MPAAPVAVPLSWGQAAAHVLGYSPSMPAEPPSRWRSSASLAYQLPSARPSYIPSYLRGQSSNQRVTGPNYSSPNYSSPNYGSPASAPPGERDIHVVQPEVLLQFQLSVTDNPSYHDWVPEEWRTGSFGSVQIPQRQLTDILRAHVDKTRSAAAWGYGTKSRW